MTEATRILFPLVNGLSGTVFLAVAAVALSRGPRVPYLRHWGWFCLCFALYTFSVLVTGGFVTDPAKATVGIRLAMTLASTSFIALFRFAVEFAKFARGRRLVPVVVGWWAILQCLFWFTRLILAGVAPSEFSRVAPVAGPLMPFYLLYVGITCFVPVLLVVRSYRRDRGRKKTQAAYMLVAFAVGAIASIGSLLPAVLGRQTLIAIVPGLLLPLYPLTITYAMVRHRLWDVRTVLHRTFVWLLLSVLLAIPLYVALRFGMQLFARVGQVELSLLLLAYFYLGYGYLRMVKPRVDHLFQRRSFDPRRAVEGFARQVVGVANPEQLVDMVQRSLDATIYPADTAFIVGDQSSAKWRVFTDVRQGSRSVLVDLDIPEAFVSAALVDASAVDRAQLDAVEGLDLTSGPLAKVDAQVAVPLVQRDRLLGLVLLGYRRNLKPYARATLEFLDQLGAEASKALANALLFEEVDQQRQVLQQLTLTLEERVRDRTQDLEQANEALKELDRYKSHFFANITHELRTPLTMILAPMDSLISGELGGLTDDQRNYLDTIRRNALRLLKLINNLLDLARIEDRRMRLRIRQTSVETLLRDVYERARPLAVRKAIRFAFDCSNETTQLYSDPEQLERVVVNLVANALKFTESGGSVCLRSVDAGGHTEISIEDTGCGIPADKIDTIFERFRQADETTTRRYGGTGIGLALAREVVALHGGTIEATSTVGEGSCFRICLPHGTTHFDPEVVVRIPTGTQAHVGAATRGSGDWTRQVLEGTEYRFLDLSDATERRRVPRPSLRTVRSAKVLLVEDNADVLQFMHLQLAGHYNVYVAQNGREGLDLVRKEMPDVVVTDFMMPEMDGIGLLRALRRDEAISSTPVVMVTAKSEVEDRLEAREAGADVYLSKPFSALELRHVIDRLLQRQEKHVADVVQTQVQSVEIMSAGLAHEIHNPLSYIRTSLFVIGEAINKFLALSQQDGDGRALSEAVQNKHAQLERMHGVAEVGVKRIQEVAELLRRVSRDGFPDEPEMLDFDGAVRNVTSLIAPKDVEQVFLTLELSAPGARVRCVPVKMHQVIRNLVQNAYDCGATKVWVRTGTAAENLIFEVLDDGPGIDPDLVSRMFTPFFTTKEPGKGLGLGLAIVQQLVSEVGGKVTVVGSGSKGGATVRVSLPLVEQFRAGAVGS